VLRTALKARQPLGPLHCIPVLLKDQVETKDMPTTYGSAVFKGFMSQRDATIVTRLKGAGAIIIAKTNMGEYASRYVGSAFGIIHNAYDTTRNPSGSSGGTGAGVAASFGLVGIGEDTGGSIRGPASVASLVGLRPTLPLVSRYGMLPANPTQDTMGPMARTVTDAATLLDAIVGYDPRDPVTAYAVGQSPKTYTAGLRPDALRGARFGVLRDLMDTSLTRSSPEYVKVRTVIDRAIASLQGQGATIVDSVVIARLDAVGDIGNDYETEQATDAYLKQHPNAPVKSFKEIMLSGMVTPWRARGMMAYVGKTTNDPGYLAVIQKREALRLSVLQAMADQKLDAIVYATYDAPPTKIAADVLTNAKTKDGYGLGDNRGLAPAIAFPAITVPAGFTSDSLPVGLEILGRPFTEAQLLGYAYAFEQGTHHRRPPGLTPALKSTR
jgi:Asp-tRNA(Asn)/Glu-tRNA(Gln) amidotransferase A subunit family amidase